MDEPAQHQLQEIPDVPEQSKRCKIESFYYLQDSYCLFRFHSKQLSEVQSLQKNMDTQIDCFYLFAEINKG